MSLTLYNSLFRDFRNYVGSYIRNRVCSTIAANVQSKENSATEKNVNSTTVKKNVTNDHNTDKKTSNLAEYRFIYPEFLSCPSFEYRHKIREKLERSDMLKRRSVIHIPEFYVGSVLAVTSTEAFAPGKQKRFVGICIHRTYYALRSTFTLRNIVDGEGIEIMYDMYNPTILSMEVLKLEKRLDDELFYLRDAHPEYSTFDFNMEPVFHQEGVPVPINPIQVKLKPYPWHAKWEQKGMKGIESTAEAPIRKQILARRAQKPWEKYDLMKEYRLCIPEEDQVEIWQDVEDYKDNFQTRHQVWKKSLQKAPNK